ncbi:glycosyltransferase (plasmid) [Leisingera aquaemixtae]|uniref:glycosyltransferase n=1 Tax=Leisingera aquaemixtae TaxID=1396826 RepID=UPI002206AE55|nr:glycosyltransferase [Leisingera aquaemixtae]
MQSPPFDIGLYPLSQDPFNAYKCAFKALEYMASGLPVVASGVGANAETVLDAETGFLCRSEEDWVRAIETLAGDADLRARFGQAGRARAEQHYDVARLAARLEGILQA